MDKLGHDNIDVQEKEIKRKTENHKVDLAKLQEEATEDLSGLVSASSTWEKESLDNEFSSFKSNWTNENLKTLTGQERESLADWKKNSADIISHPDSGAIQESWRQAAEDQFGIKDFQVEKFKRVLMNDESVVKAFASGHDWNYIFDNQDKFVSGESYDAAVEVFKTMTELDEEAPGSVKKLHEKYGITNFQRYPKEILLQQLNETDKSKEIALMLFAGEDWNGAFDKQSDVWKKIYDQQKEVRNFRVVECDNNVALARELIKLKQEFKNKVSLAILSAHSEPEGFYLGAEKDDKGYVGQDLIAKNISNLKEIFTDKAQLIGNACSSGALNGWVKDFSRDLRISAVGPDRPAAIEDVDFIGNELVPKYYDNDVYSGYNNGYLLSKKKS
ncbi:MAG: hypothetical protein WCN88_02005 [Candidatus Falkowbacteria bacterium]